MQAKNTEKQKTVSFQDNFIQDPDLGEAHKNLEDMTNRLVA